MKLHTILYKLIFLKIQTIFGYRILKCSLDRQNQSSDSEVLHDVLAVSDFNEEQTINQNI